MKIYFKNIHEAVAPRLLARTEQRIGKLEKFIDTGQFESLVFVEISRAMGSHQSGNIWQTSINLDAGGDRFNARAVADTPERASTKAIQELAAELRKTHARDKDHSRRQGSIWKSIQNTFKTP